MNAPHPTEVHRIDPKDRVPLGQKSAYAMGVVSDHYAQFAINAFLMPFFNIVLKLPPTWIGTAMGIARLWDAINDPAVGSLSDHTKSRFGRRRPYLFVGAILTGIVFPLIWLVPRDWSDQAMMAWLVVALLLFYTCYSILSVPYESLGMELTPDYQERTNLFTFRTYLMKLFDLGITWLMPLATTLASWLAADQLLGTGLIIDTEPYDEQLDLLTEQNLLRTIPWVAIGVGAIIIVTGILPAIFCVERYAHIAQKQRGENPVRSLLSLLMNRPFVVVMGGTSLYLLGIMSNSVLGFYVHTYYIYDADLAQGAILGGYHGTVSLVFSFVGAFIVQLVSGRIDKKPLLLICVLLMLGSAVLMSVTYLPGRPYLTLATRPIQSIAETGFWILVISMRADVGDWDEYVNGRRREGMIAALGNWMVKLAITLSAIIGGVLLQYLVGFDAELAGDQNPGTLDRLKWTYVVVQASCIATVFGVLTLYPLSRGKLSDVRAELEQRREAV